MQMARHKDDIFGDKSYKMLQIGGRNDWYYMNCSKFLLIHGEIFSALIHAEYLNSNNVFT